MNIEDLTNDELRAEITRRKLRVLRPTVKGRPDPKPDDRPQLRKLDGVETEEKLKTFIERSLCVSHTLYAAFGHEPGES